MSYQRVIPRDLFNESSLLKCYGALYIALEKYNGRARFSEEDVPSFDIVQRDEDGAIFIENLALIVGQGVYRLTRPLNSRQPWPLHAEKMLDANFDPIAVFNDDGTLSPEMRDLLALTEAA